MKPSSTNIFLIALLILGFWLTNGCSGNPEKISSQKIYFDLQGFLDEQVAQLYKDSLIVLKTSEINDKTDQHEMPWTDWRKELALFYASDINKPSFIGKYGVDTTYLNENNDGTTLLISYKATDPALRTRLMEVTIEKESREVRLLHIINESGNFLSSAREDLYYAPMKSYIIRSVQQMKLFGEDTLAVKGDIVSKERKYF